MKVARHGGANLFLMIVMMIQSCNIVAGDVTCEIISNHSVNGVEYKQCSDGRLLKVTEPQAAKDATTTHSTDEPSPIPDKNGKPHIHQLKLIDENDVFFGANFGKQLEKIEAALVKRERIAKNHAHARKLGIVYKHNGFDDNGHHQHPHLDDEAEEEHDALIKASTEEVTVPPTTASDIKLPDTVSDPKGVDVKELIAIAHNKPYRHETTTPKPVVHVPQDLYRPHDAVHFGNLRYLDFAPTTEVVPAKEKKSHLVESVDTPPADTPTDISDTATENPRTVIVIQPVREKVSRNQNGAMFQEIQKTITTIDGRPDLVTKNGEPWLDLSQTQIIIAFATPLAAFFAYCVFIFCYVNRKKANAKRRLIPKANHYKHFGEEEEAAALGFAV